MLILALVGCWGNGRNHWNSGNPSMEALLQSCEVGGWTVRLYEGQPDATVAFWSSVTVERPGLAERQVLYAYGSPLYDRVVCTELGPVLQGASDAPRTLPLAELETLRERPLRFWKGKIEP